MRQVYHWKRAMHLILLWALVAIIGQVECKCSLAPVIDDVRLIAYTCTHGDLNDLEEISSEADWIEFTVSRFRLIPDNAFWRFKNLKRLSFYNCHIDFINPGAFSDLTKLEWLIFHGTRIHVARSAWFRPLLNLRKLILDRCGLVHIEPDVFRAIPRLEVLGLRDNDLDCVSINDLAYLRMLKIVRTDRNPWLCECKQRLDEYFRSRGIVQEVECMRQIKFCKRYQCMSPIEFSTFPHILTNQNLYDYNQERVSTRENVFQTSVFNSLDRLPDKTTSIKISDVKINTLPRYAFFRFGNSLRSLDLNDCKISVIESEAFAGLHKLQVLSLVGNNLPVVGATWFRDLVNLQQLILERNNIEQIERTAFWHLGGSLRHLDIKDNLLRCIGIEELGELNSLERLDITGNPWLCSCRQNLQNVLIQRNIGFEINSRQCIQNENEITDGASDWNQQQSVTEGTTTIAGKVHWSSFEDTIKQTNISIYRPRPPSTTPSEIYTATFQPPIYTGSCYLEKNDRGHRSIYICKGITTIEDLNVIPSTANSIHVTSSNIKKIPENTFKRFNGYLSKLVMQNSGIEKIESYAFSNLRNVEYLSLRGNKLDSIESDTVHGIYNLRHLDLSHNNIYRITNGVFEHLPYLTSLDVSDNAMNCIGVEYIAQRLRYLSSLDVSNNPWSCLCGTKLAEFLKSHDIKYDKNSLFVKEDCYAPELGTTSTPVISVATTSAPFVNETIEGSCTIIQNDNTAIRYRCTDGNLFLLRSIPPDATAIEFYAGHLPRLPAETFLKFTNLRQLIIRNSGLSTVEQGAFNGLHKLENLTIQDNPIEMIDSPWFTLNNLQRLDLRGNSIKYIEPESFRRLKQLTYLNLEGNDLKCIYTSDLNDLPNVYIIEFSGNPLKWRCRIELEQFLEARKIGFVKMKNSCEGKKLVSSMLYQNKTDGSFDCPSDCSLGVNVKLPTFILFIIVPLIMIIY